MARRRPTVDHSPLTEAQKARLRALWSLVADENSPDLREALGEYLMTLEGAAPIGVLAIYNYRLKLTKDLAPIGTFVHELLGEVE